MNILYIGGTGNISAACVRRSVEKGHKVFVLNRGKSKANIPPEVYQLYADIQDEGAVRNVLAGRTFDVVVNFIAYHPEDIERDIRLFSGHIGQYIFISSASVYQKPLNHPIITESTPLVNPYWQYSRDKIACEDLLISAHRNQGFPMTIIRPSLTYETVIPVAIGGWTEFTIIDRIRTGKPIIVHGDGTSIWTITHSIDFAKGFCGLLGHPQAIGQSFHITSDELLTWNQVYEAVMEAAGASTDMIHIPSAFIGKFSEEMRGNLFGDKAVSTIFDNSKIKRYVPEFVATIPFHQGIKTTIQWLDEDKSRQVRKPETDRFMDQVIAAYLR